MTTAELLNELAQRKIQLWAEGDRLGFDIPKGSLTTTLREALRTRQAEILAFLQQKKRAAIAQILPTPRDEPIPLSFAQQRLWFLAQMEGAKDAYQISFALRFQGVLDVTALQQSLDHLVDRHEILRTTFALVDEQPCQIIAAHLTLPLTLSALDGQLPAEQTSSLRQQALQLRQQPFDLVHGPLLRAHLFRLAPEDHLLLLTMHHIITDGWSLGVLQQEINALYKAFRTGQPNPLPPLPVQYADFTHWQRACIQGERLTALLAYWQQQLADAPTFFSLPTDRPHPAVQSYQGAVHRSHLSEGLTEQLKQLARQQGVTLFMLLQAAFAVLLYRFSGQNDLLVGTPIANRTHLELQSLIGCLVNTLVLRNRIEAHLPFTSLLRQVQQTTLAAYEHQDLPFELLVDALQPTRSMSYNPLIQVMFALQNIPRPVSEGFTRNPLNLEWATAAFDLSLSLYPNEAGLRSEWEYNSDLFDASTIERLASHLQTLLTGIVANPAQAIADLPLLTTAERQQLLVAWNDTATDYPSGKTIHQLFEEQVARTPEAVAVVMAVDLKLETERRNLPQGESPVTTPQSLTYGELNARANQLAHYLQSLGVGPEVLVGICVERSIEMVVGLLAILKAGGAYVPLDPTYPQERLAFMLKDANPPVLLTQEHLLTQLPITTAQIVCLDRDWPLIALQPREQFVTNVQPEHLAYVIYTSGSTGQPKGVMIEHLSLTNFLWMMRTRPGFTADDILLAVTTLSFDIAGLELYLPLITGGKLVLVDRETTHDGVTLASAILRYHITVMQATPATWRLLLSAGWQGGPMLKLLCGGEALPRSLADPLLRCGRELWNLYGPTETTIWSTFTPVGADDSQIPIGGGPSGTVANTQLYLLDTALSPVPIGVSGELYIGGAGVARGYLNRPELTQEKFIPNPFGAGRLYKTGDLARWLPHGDIEFLGRIDGQVKLRGFRIELGEIEAVLAQHPAVQEAVVVAREDTPGEKRLVAYIILDQEITRQAPTLSLQAEVLPKGDQEIGQNALSLAGLRSYLSSKLPEYMLPSAFVVLDALPLTPNGKIDRKALPVPQVQRLEGERVQMPGTISEAMLVAIWQGVLQVNELGIEDNFFELGGHSLLLTQVVSRIRQAFAVEVSLRTLFANPTLAGMAREVDRLRQTKQQLLQPRLLSVAREGRLPLSYAQQRLWLLSELGSGAAYNIPMALQVEGVLAVAVLQAALQEIVRRHESLRTTIRLSAASDGVGESDLGVPCQMIHTAVEVDVPVVDLGGLDAAAQETAVRQRAEAEALKPFDLSRDLMLRAQVLQLDNERHVLLLTMHHIAADGWSLGVLKRELALLYAAYSQGQPSPLPDLPIQYADFTVWQRAYLQGAVLERQLAWWQTQLNGAPALLALPTDRPRPAQQSFQGAAVKIEIGAGLTQALRQLGRQQGCTLYMTLLAAFYLLLYRYTGQADVVVGSPIANRTRAELEPLIGFFVNTLALRCNLAGNPTFLQLLRQVQATTQAAYDYQDLPFERVVEALHLERNLAYNPLVQVIFALQNAVMERFSLPGLQVSPAQFGAQATRMDLECHLWEVGDRLTGALIYNRDLFNASTIERLASHLQTLLTGIVANPEQAISDLLLLTASERHQLLIEWNDTTTDYPSDKTIHQLFEEQVAHTPAAVALVMAEDQEARRSASADHPKQGDKERTSPPLPLPLSPDLTYAELNARANQLAHHLQRLGVGPDVLVGICVERSLEMVVGLLAILKAGGGYVPLDPSYPQERLAFMLNDANTPLLLTQHHLKASLPTTNTHVVCIDSDWQPLMASLPSTNPVSFVQPNHLAYVIYTSGSTGKPKGAMNEHRGVVNRLLWMQKQYRLRNDDRILQKTPFSFDVSVWEFFWPLLTGAQLIMAKPEGHKDPDYLVDVIQRYKITTLHFVPSMLSAFLEANQLTGCRSLRRVICSGEALSYELQKRFFSHFSVALHNLYGPTEAAVDVTYWQCQPDDQRPIVPIGRPVSNTQMYILDPHFHPVPIGVAGELYIGGVQVGRGYLNRAELTHEKFIANPFREGRLYRTGDLARWLPDGNIEYLGRIDQQVKLHGFRIELGEIESVLTHHPAIQDAVVMLREDMPGEKRLVAYVVEKWQAASDTKQAKDDTALRTWQPVSLRTYLQDILPEYMVPNAFVLLDTLPLTPNGKVDRKALPVPPVQRREGEEIQTPSTVSEVRLVAIWRDVLKVSEVGSADNFFELGGHSLLLTQVVSRIRQAFAVEVPLRKLFACPTLSGMAREVDRLQQRKQQVLQPVLLPTVRGGSLPLSYGQQRLWFLDKFGSGSAYNMPIALAVAGVLDVAVLQAALNEIVRRHESLRTTFRVTEDRGLSGEAEGEGGMPSQVIHRDVEVSVPVWDLCHLEAGEQETRVREVAQAEAVKPFDLTCDLMLRTQVLKLAKERYVLLLTLHHIASDGWSLGVLMKELAALYAAYSQGKPSPLPELAIQYADFAVWQRNYLQGEVLERQLQWWQEQLRGAPALLLLPTDHPRPAQQRFQGAAVTLEIDAALTCGLRQLSRQQGCTLYMTLLAAFQSLLYRYTGQEDVVVGSPIANRNRAELESLIGFFVNTLVLRCNLAGNPTFLQVLTQVQATTQAAYDQQDLPFERLVEALQPERNLAYSPLVQVAFALQNAEMAGFFLPGLQLSPIKFGVQTIHLDLECHLREVDDRLTGALVYNCDLFDESTIQRMAGHFQTLLSGIVANPEQAISHLPLLTEAERQAILVEWNKTARDFPRDKTIHQLFEEQVARTPEAVAVVMAEERETRRTGEALDQSPCLTYRQLNERANQLAHHLQSLGVGPEVLVGICVERSIEMVVGLLAILKAGGAYVPMDPTYPPERLAFMLNDSAVPILLTQSHLTVVQGAAQPGTHIIAVDSLNAYWADQPTHNPQPQTTPAHLAYVIYTSGSTGQPKGTLIEHGGAFYVAMAQASVLPALTTGSRLLQVASLGFDAATFEIMMALLHGVTLVLPPANHERLGAALAELLVSQAITHVTLVPSVLQTMPAVELPDLQVLITAGEACPPELATRWAGQYTFFNLYGPTESPIWTTYATLQSGQSVHIGQPIPNRKVYILDANGEMLPIGVPGELYIGGPQLARGYLNRPKLTAERFIEHPQFGRLYKTGDLCRWLPSGNIEYMSRTDSQVKLRGFRIELGEIESALLAQEGVSEAVVLVREDTPADKRLIVYWVGEADNEILRQKLAQRLPAYMIPAAFVRLDAMPLTPNGKLDRRALPAPGPIRSTASYTPPSSVAEQRIAAAWSAVLQQKELSIYDNFFDAGGHSLLITRLHTLLRPDYPTLKVVDLFSYPTVAGLARYLDQAIHHEVRQNGYASSKEQASETRGAKRREQQAARLQQKVR